MCLTASLMRIYQFLKKGVELLSGIFASRWKKSMVEETKRGESYLLYSSLNFSRVFAHKDYIAKVRDEKQHTPHVVCGREERK